MVSIKYVALSEIQEIILDTILIGLFLTLVLYYFIFSPIQKRYTNLHQELSKALKEISIFDAEFAHKLLHDELTGLPNRFLFHDRLEHEIIVTERESGSFALLFIDPGSLSAINEALGHKAGDQVIIDISERLTHLIRKSDTLARLASDEFALLMPTVDTEEIGLMADRIHQAFKAPFLAGDVEVDITINIGISLFPLHATSSVDLMRRTDMAMRQAKSESLSTLVYDAKQESIILSKREQFRELRKAVNQGAFELYFQPKMDLKTNEVVSVEALVRLLDNPNISPADFIPLAEQTGLVHDISIWVLEHAVQQLKTWQEEGIHLSIAVNISARDLMNHNLCQDIESLLRKYDVDKSKLSIELTESMLMDNPDISIATLHNLSNAGFKLSIDDYGTGQSSLSYLQQLPASELKIDQVFIRHILEGKHEAAIVKSTIQLAHSLQMTVVAEGVENADICNFLADLGCDKAQGYYISKPQNAENFTSWYNSLDSGVFRA